MYEPIFSELERAFDRAFLDNNNSTYPPYDLIRTGEDTYDLVLAVAGFDFPDLDIVVADNTLTIRGEHAPDDDEGPPTITYIRRGIAQRKFVRSFTLHNYLQVTGASMEDGLLTVRLKSVVPESATPRKIAIT